MLTEHVEPIEPSNNLVTAEAKKFRELSESPDFLRLSTQEILDIIENDQLLVEDETIIFDGLMKWIKHDVERRKLCLSEVLAHIRWNLIPPHQLVDVVFREKLLRDDKLFPDLLYQTLTYHLLPNRTYLLPASWKRLRTIYVPRTYILLVGGISTDLVEIESLKLKPNPSGSLSWKRIKVKTRRYDDCLTLFKGKIYRLGGIESTNYTLQGHVVEKKVDYFDCKAKIWREIVSINQERKASAATAWGNRLYICGGRNETNWDLNSVEFYDSGLGRWNFTVPMLRRRSYHAAVTLHGRIYAIGGLTEEGPSQTVEVFDPDKEQWTLVQPMLAKRVCHAAAVLNDKIYVCGGNNGSLIPYDSAEVYDPSINSWSAIQPMKNPRDRPALAAFLSKLYAIGGSQGLTGMKSVEVYDPQTNTWTEGPGLRKERLAAFAAAINDF